MPSFFPVFLSVLAFESTPPAPATQPSPTSRPAIPTGFLYRTLTVGGETYAYSIFVPPEYDPTQPWPVVLFLHGSGERGTDGFLQTEVGLANAIRRNYRLVPAVVVMPQCRPNQSWVGPMGELALRCVEHTSQDYALDPQRVYLTGLSLGGHGAWHLAAAYPQHFAAVVPICGFAEYKTETGVAAQIAPRLASLPIWCFHGAKDDAVPVEKSRRLVELVKAAGGRITYTEIPDGGHNVWDKGYLDPQLWRWVFEQRLAAPASTRPARD